MSSVEEPAGRVAAISTGVQYPPSEGICYVRFWYYMHNDDTTANIGSLRLIVEGWLKKLCLSSPISFFNISGEPIY